MRIQRNKISDQIISQIRDQILSGLLKPGDKLASEKELMLQFGVSKATMREALRVLEVMGLLEIKKGVGGGAFVAEVDMKSTVHSLINYMHFHPVSIKEITMLRYLIEPGVAQIAALEATQDDISRLSKLVDETPINYRIQEYSREITFHRYLARITKNTTLILLVDFVDNLLTHIKARLPLGPDFHQKVKEAHEIILECIRQRDPLATKLAMATDLLEVGRLLSDLKGSERFDPCAYELREGQPVPCEWTGGARVVREGDPMLKEPTVWTKRIGTSNLFIVLPT